CIRCYSR
ncbi:araC-family transcriptional regulatory domain protein, partial [Vibrio parahaemolyticus EKP-021]